VAAKEGLKLSEDVAEAIIEKGIEYGAYSDEMPDTKKAKLAAADEIVSFSIDAYVNDGITSDDDDPAVAESGEQIEEILEMAGVSIEDGEPVFGKVPALDADDDDDNGDDAEEGDEEPFNPDDYIEGYSELSVVTKLKKVKELDPEDDDDAAVLDAIAEWEEEQDKPSGRILNYIEEVLGDEDEPESEDDNGDDDEPEAEAEEEAEPWEGYDKSSAVDIKKVLKEASEDEDEPLTVEQVQYVKEYEEARERPRKRVVDYCDALLSEMENGGEEPEDEPEEKPKRGRGRAKGRDKKPEPKADSNGVITLTREQILTALTDGEVEIAV